MAAADTARLIASLTLDAKGFTSGLTAAEKKLGQVESTAFRVGQNIGKGTEHAIRNIGKIGLVAAGGIALAVRGGLGDLATLESAITSVDGAIQQLGLTGQLTGKQVADWADDIEANIDAAFDDKAITQAAATLIRFGKVAPDSLRKALEVTADLAAKTGDVESASDLLAKALADPTKAAGKLSRQGIILTKVQQDTIKAMVKQNDVAGAQALVLDIVAKQTDGAAKAMAGPYQDALNKTNDAIEDARKALAVGFLPIITKVADKLSTIAADPKALASIKSFGETLAGGLDSLISTAERLPWAAIGTSLQIAGAGAKVLLDAFVSLPPWVQTAVITGWGLNKLTGGALGGIVAELGKGLIKGVLGIQAGHVTVNAATVSGVGAGPAGVAGAGAKGTLATAANFVMKVAIVGIAADVASTLSPLVNQAGADIGDALGFPTFDIGLNDLQWPFGPKNTPTILPEIFGGNGLLGGTATPPPKGQGALGGAEAVAKVVTAQNITNERLESIRGYTSQQAETQSALLRANERNEAVTREASAKAQQAAFATRDALSQKLGFVAAVTSSVRDAVTSTTAAARAAGQQTAFAIRDKDLSVSVQNINNIKTSVSVRETINTQTTYKQYARYIS